MKEKKKPSNVQFFVLFCFALFLLYQGIVRTKFRVEKQ